MKRRKNDKNLFVNIIIFFIVLVLIAFVVFYQQVKSYQKEIDEKERMIEIYKKENKEDDKTSEQYAKKLNQAKTEIRKIKEETNYKGYNELNEEEKEKQLAKYNEGSSKYEGLVLIDKKIKENKNIKKPRIVEKEDGIGHVEVPKGMIGKIDKEKVVSVLQGNSNDLNKEEQDIVESIGNTEQNIEEPKREPIQPLNEEQHVQNGINSTEMNPGVGEQEEVYPKDNSNELEVPKNITEEVPVPTEDPNFNEEIYTPIQDNLEDNTTPEETPNEIIPPSNTQGNNEENINDEGKGTSNEEPAQEDKEVMPIIPLEPSISNEPPQEDQEENIDDKSNKEDDDSQEENNRDESTNNEDFQEDENNNNNNNNNNVEGNRETENNEEKENTSTDKDNQENEDNIDNEEEAQQNKESTQEEG